MQDQQVRPRAGRDCVGATLIVPELHEQSLAVKQLDDGADLPARKLLLGLLEVEDLAEYPSLVPTARV